jgi:hypothetical protein
MRTAQRTIHAPVAVRRHHRRPLLVQQLLESQRKPARLDNLGPRRLHNRLGALDPQRRFRFRLALADGVVGIEDAFEPDLLDFRPELSSDVLGLVGKRPGRQVQNLRLAQMMNRPKRPDSRGQLTVVAAQDAH